MYFYFNKTNEKFVVYKAKTSLYGISKHIFRGAFS